MQTRFFRTLVLLMMFGILIGSAMAAGKGLKKRKEPSAASSSSPKNKKRQTTPRTEQAGPQRRLWFYTRLSTVFDSNIDHDVQEVQSFGFVPSLGVHFQNSLEKPTFEVDYETGFHSYTNSTRWDRTSHKLRVAHERRFNRWLTAEITGEMTIRGSSEDRELNNQYVLGQQFELRPSRAQRFKLFAAYRLKRYPLADSDRNAIDPYVGGSFEQRFGPRSLEFSYRYDKNRSWSDRNRYIRWTYGAEFKTPFIRRDALLTVEAKYRSQLYARTVEIEADNGPDFREPRRDRRWILDVSWQRPLNDKLLLGFMYRFEARRSNDLDKTFNSHLGGVTLTYRWWR